MLRKKRILGLFRPVELIFLGLLLSLVVSYLAWTNSFATLHNILATVGIVERSKDQQPRYHIGQAIQVQKSGPYHQWIGTINKQVEDIAENYRVSYHYEVVFPIGKVTVSLPEHNLKKPDKPRFKKGDIVKLSSLTKKPHIKVYQGQLATIKQVKKRYDYSLGGYQY
ncbi:TPA: hypothetical protein ACQMR2_001732, partial [Streptococcus pyogenes]